ncbi:4-coumarate-- ligase-like 7 [Fusarium albosuccineum]|uniref:4-coumarate-- ligase-like 7 n=1 Tax=Fusarium albosuccineum TaxID=1237068 RepID=A0A8H4PBU2_9HYPO|nr:4-coumarate-- ligase-like 7 [Fusarium albosuccineum]
MATDPDAASPRKLSQLEELLHLKKIEPRTVEDDFVCNSIKSQFLLPGTDKAAVTYSVARLREGRSYVTRMVHAVQEGRQISVAMISFARKLSREHQHVRHAALMARVEEPNTEERHNGCDVANDTYAPELSPVTLGESSFPPQDRVLRCWIRAPQQISQADDLTVHQAVLAFLSDWIAISVIPYVHGYFQFPEAILKSVKSSVFQGTDIGMLSTLSHSIYFHSSASIRADDWMLIEVHSPWAGNERCLATAKMFATDGTMLATYFQEPFKQQRLVFIVPQSLFISSYSPTENMVFNSPSWVPPLPKLPDTSIFEFMFNEDHGRASFESSLPAYVCGLSGGTVSAREQKSRTETLARGLALELAWGVNEGSEMDKVVGTFALNTIDIPTLTWAVHRLNGVCAPVNSAFTSWELAQQLQKTSVKVLFTVLPLLEVAKEAAKQCGIPEHRIYVCEMHGIDQPTSNRDFLTIGDILAKGKTAPELEALQWAPGRSQQQVAFLSHSSGTSGAPTTLYEQKGRGGSSHRETVLGVLPHSHIYGVVMISHLSTFRGDSVIVLPKFDMSLMLASVARYQISTLNIVPPIILAMSKNPDLLQRYDLSSIKSIVSGGAPLSQETIARLAAHRPDWVFRQAYGLTEAAGCACHTSAHDPWQGSSGSIVTGCEIKLVDRNDQEVLDHGKTGEIWIKSPGNILGYLDDKVATNETFLETEDGRWLRSGDIGLFKQSPSGTEHIFIVDRVKELIKVKGNQVVPAELENLLVTHPAVAECAVIGVHDHQRGEVPRAYIQRTDSSMVQFDNSLSEELDRLVRGKLARYKWLRGGILFVREIPKSPSGKVLRRLLRDQAITDSTSRSKL